MMKRRQFSSAMLGAGTALLAAPALLLPRAAKAQGAPVDGRHYVSLSQPLPVATPPGKFEAIEFFWYGCPHCYAFEPSLDFWAKSLPGDVAFRRVPVAFRPAYIPHQRIFYALDALGLVDAYHRKVFAAIHTNRMRLEQRDEIAAFAGNAGLEQAKFMEAYDSFSVLTKSTQANALAAAYKIDGVPAIGIQGRYYTAGTLAGSNEKSLAVADYLLQRLRKPV
jgi:thiol:disulfide interchange protein DsbA